MTSRTWSDPTSTGHFPSTPRSLTHNWHTRLTSFLHGILMGCRRTEWMCATQQMLLFTKETGIQAAFCGISTPTDGPVASTQSLPETGREAQRHLLLLE